jgi:hypothetical protein
MLRRWLGMWAVGAVGRLRVSSDSTQQHTADGRRQTADSSVGAAPHDRTITTDADPHAAMELLIVNCHSSIVTRPLRELYIVDSRPRAPSRRPAHRGSGWQIECLARRGLVNRGLRCYKMLALRSPPIHPRALKPSSPRRPVAPLHSCCRQPATHPALVAELKPVSTRWPAYDRPEPRASIQPLIDMDPDMLRSRSKPLPHPFFCTLCPPPCRASDKTAARPCSLLNTTPAHTCTRLLCSPPPLLLLLLFCPARPAPPEPLTSLGCYLRPLCIGSHKRLSVSIPQPALCSSAVYCPRPIRPPNTTISLGFAASDL